VADEAASAPQRFTSRRTGELLIGRLKDHGAANYQFRAKEDPSYYLKIITSRGERTLWGKDLGRALAEGETKPQKGDLIGARRSHRELVTITTRARGVDGTTTTTEQRAHRTRWVVEKVIFFAERARLARRLRDEQVDVKETVKAHPELKSTFLSVRAAEDFAAKRIANPEDRERFLALVKGAMEGSIRKGEPLPSVRLKDGARRPEPAAPAKAGAKRDEPTR
jgi:ribosomal protein L17